MILETTAPIPARTPRSGHIRIYADPAGAAELMRHIVGARLCDALLAEEAGHWYVDVRDGEGVLREVVDLLSVAMKLGRIGYAMLCVDGRTFTFQPDPARRPAPAEPSSRRGQEVGSS
jgi:hypothetical protein